MKQRATALIISILLIGLSACNKQMESSTHPKTQPEQKTEEKTNNNKKDDIRTIQLITGQSFTEEWAEDSYETIIRTGYPATYIYYEDENNFPELKKALEDYNKSEKDYHLKFIDENKDYALESYLEKGEYFCEFESTATPYVRRADTLVTGILYSGYEYMGGVHGIYYYYGKTYDTKTGKELMLSDVINDKNLLTSAVSEQLYTHWSDAGLNESADIEGLINDETAFSWTLDYNGITIYFMPYSIASYASGVQIVTISNEEYPDILKDEFKNTPSSYGIELTNNAPFYYDITKDGKVDEIIFSAYNSDYEGNSGVIDFYVNGKSLYTEKSWFYDSKATFVHAKNGNNYICVELLLENDYRKTLIFDLSYGITKIDSVDGGLRRIYHEGEENIITHDVLTNPESFYLQSHTHHLSSVTGYKKYHIGENGVLKSYDDNFIFDEEYLLTFTMLQDFEADSFDEKADKVTGKKTLKLGEEVFYVGTDNEKYAYLKSSDGTLVRVEVVLDKESWRYTINGIDTEEIFDGLFYAG